MDPNNPTPAPTVAPPPLAQPPITSIGPAAMPGPTQAWLTDGITVFSATQGTLSTDGTKLTFVPALAGQPPLIITFAEITQIKQSTYFLKISTSNASRRMISFVDPRHIGTTSAMTGIAGMYLMRKAEQAPEFTIWKNYLSTNPAIQFKQGMTSVSSFKIGLAVGLGIVGITFFVALLATALG